MHLAAFQLRQLLQRAPGVIVAAGRQSESDQYLVGVKTWVAAAQIADFQILDRFDGFWLDQSDIMSYACQIFQGI